MIPRLSDYLKVSPKALLKHGVFDAFIGVDTAFFLDPHLLRTTKIPDFKSSHKKIQDYFRILLTLLIASEQNGDRAWREAYRRLIFKEMSGIAIGYGKGKGNGSGIGPKLAAKLVSSANEIITMGVKEPEIFALLGLFEEDFGADRLSDMTVRIISDDLFAYTERVTKSLDIRQVSEFRKANRGFVLPYSEGKSKREPLIFLPTELLRDLPVAMSWDEIGKVTALNQELRDRLNSLIAKVWIGGKKAPKSAIRKFIFDDPENIQALVEAYKKSGAVHYDFERDPTGQLKWSKYGPEFAKNFPIKLQLPTRPTLDQVETLVLEIVRQFKRNIEVNGLKEHLYDRHGLDRKPLHEKYAQLLFYSVADSYCAANNLDLSREPNAGNGPVDFKVSKGYVERVLVEIKLTSNKQLLAGLTEQLKAYRESENTDRSVYLVIRVTESDNSIKQLQQLNERLTAEGKQIPKIVFVDARILPSASKRKSPR